MTTKWPKELVREIENAISDCVKITHAISQEQKQNLESALKGVFGEEVHLSFVSKR